MKVVFWNTARGSSMMSEQFEKILENCLALAHGKPEVIVLCEGLKGTRKKIRDKGGLPGYTLIKPAKDYATYFDQDTLRYIIFARNDMKCVATYFATGEHRPAVHLSVNGFAFMAIHATSATSTVKPQTKALKKALEEVANTPHNVPAVIFGDLNVNAREDTKRTTFIDDLSAELNKLLGGKKFIPQYDLHLPTRPKSQKSLDWALINPSFTSAVTVTVMRDEPEPKVGKKRKLDDGDYVPGITSTEKSDHEAILIEIK